MTQEQLERVWPGCELCSSGRLEVVGFDDRIYLSGGNSRPPEDERFHALNVPAPSPRRRGRS